MGRVLLLGVSLLLSASAASGQTNADQMEWGPPPPSLPEGALLAVLSGNPDQQGLFTIRLRLPPGYKIPPHRHSGPEYVTVIAGEIGYGAGRTYNERKAVTLTRGAFIPGTANTDHFAWTKEGATIQITGVGPFDVTYVRPRDDPRRKR